jgi:UPF0271 protein
VPFAAEFFADRGLDDDGSLLARGTPGAFIEDTAQAAERVVVAVRDGRIAAASGKPLDVTIHTICVHSDSPGALERARAVRAALEAAGIALEPLRDWL